MVNFLKRFSIYPVLLFIVIFIVCVRNYTPGTYLTGWDNLHPEFNFGVNISRSISAVWQEYQGLGLLGGMAHAADLPRQLFLFLTSAVLPQNFLRYFWTFGMLFLGPFGVYVLTKKGSGLISFTSALYYLLNLATVQNFYNPYEAFVSFYGFLPWFIYFSIKYLTAGKRRDLILLFSFLIVGATSFYVQTLFVVLAVILVAFAIETIFRLKKTGIKRVLKLFLTLFIATSFWLFPVLYFTLTNSSVVTTSKINVLSTPETQLMNKGFGNLASVSTLRGFWLEYTDLGRDNKFTYLYDYWKKYLTSNTLAVGYLIFGISLIGIIYLLFNKKLNVRSSIFFVFVLGFYLMMGGSLPLPLFDQIFRSVFTKWAVLMALIYSIGIASFLALVSRFLKKEILLFVVASLIISGTLVFAKPVFQGYLISPTMRIDIPKQYFSLFDYFKNQDKQGRIAFYPVQTFWGWNFYTWGYRGSGFLWYGIPQPILDRAFDVWSNSDESFYHEINTAVYAEDATGVLNVIKKYNVTYVLMDKSVIYPEADRDVFKFDKSLAIFESIGGKIVFQKDFLTVFQFSKQEQPAFYSNVESSGNLVRKDSVFENVSDYASSIKVNNQYPFSDVLREEITGIDYSHDIGGAEYVSIKRKIEGILSKLFLPSLNSQTYVDLSGKASYENHQIKIEFNNPYMFKRNQELIELSNIKPILIDVRNDYSKVAIGISNTYFYLKNNETINISGVRVDTKESVQVKVFDASNGKSIDLTSLFLTSSINKCWEREGRSGAIGFKVNGDQIDFTSRDAIGCASLRLGEFQGSPESLLEVSLPYKSVSESRPDFCIVIEGRSDCLNNDVFYHSFVSTEWSEVTRQILVSSGKNYWLVVSARPSEKSGETWNISYKAPKVFSYPEIGSFSFSGIWNGFNSDRAIDVSFNKGDELEVTFPVKPEKVDFSKTGRNSPSNCDVLQRGEVYKKTISGRLFYEASGRGASCDFSNISNVATDNDFILRLVGENVTGRGMKFYVFDKATNNNDLEMLLNSGKFDQSFGLLKSVNFAKNEFILNLETRSLGGEDSLNYLDGVYLYSIPLNWLSNLKVFDGNIQPQENLVQVNSSRKIGTFWYEFDLNVLKDNSLFSLPQGYDKGWISLPASAHVKVNSWENGWILPKGHYKLVIFYWPQTLEFLGMVMIFGFVFLVIVDKARRRK
ncbi:MAG: hypothetical protein HY044_00160 [Candidatus Woesebacteria bacterium]|nr:MAG: hypothetical protein HY044_00160 [Candidatus Woesebacteria bacterium]